MISIACPIGVTGINQIVEMPSALRRGSCAITPAKLPCGENMLV
jgi:hypothetical protein